MPLPLLIAGAAIAGVYGVKKGVDAKSDFNDASDINKKAKKKYKKATKKLKKAQESAQYSLESLGSLKFDILETSIIPFIDSFEKIKNINYEDSNLVDNSLPIVSSTEMKSMQGENVQLKELVSGGLASLGAGGVAGLAAYGGIGVLGTASTGTAIGTLGGAAATNATLAWLGGGSLATGGLGIAGGTAVLGGIVAGPVLAIGGMMAASKAEAAVEDAYSNLSQAEAAAAQMNKAVVMTSGIERRFDEVSNTLSELVEYFTPLLQSFQELTLKSTDYSSYSDLDKKGVFIVASTAKTLKNLLEVDILDADGSLTESSSSVLRETNKSLENLNPDHEKQEIADLSSILDRYKDVIKYYNKGEYEPKRFFLGADLTSKMVKKWRKNHECLEDYTSQQQLQKTRIDLDEALLIYDDRHIMKEHRLKNGLLVTNNYIYVSSGYSKSFGIEEITSIDLFQENEEDFCDDVWELRINGSYVLMFTEEKFDNFTALVAAINEYKDQF